MVRALYQVRSPVAVRSVQRGGDLLHKLFTVGVGQSGEHATIQKEDALTVDRVLGILVVAMGVTTVGEREKFTGSKVVVMVEVVFKTVTDIRREASGVENSRSNVGSGGRSSRGTRRRSSSGESNGSELIKAAIVEWRNALVNVDTTDVDVDSKFGVTGGNGKGTAEGLRGTNKAVVAIWRGVDKHHAVEDIGDIRNIGGIDGNAEEAGNNFVTKASQCVGL